MRLQDMADSIYYTLMKNKRYPFKSVMVLFLMISASFVTAELPRESLLYNADLRNLSVILGYDRQERLVRQEDLSSTEELLKSDSGFLMLEYDLNYWISVCLGVGETKAKPEISRTVPGYETSEQKQMWAYGIHANIWQGDIFEPHYFMSRCRIQSSLTFWKHDTTLYDNDLNWDEMRADLTFSVESFVKGLGEDKTESPYSLVLYAGLLHSDLYLDVVPSGGAGTRIEYEDSESTGLRAGLNLKLYHNLYVGYEVRVYEETSQSARLAYHF